MNTMDRIVALRRRLHVAAPVPSTGGLHFFLDILDILAGACTRRSQWSGNWVCTRRSQYRKFSHYGEKDAYFDGPSPEEYVGARLARLERRVFGEGTVTLAQGSFETRNYYFWLGAASTDTYHIGPSPWKGRGEQSENI